MEAKHLVPVIICLILTFGCGVGAYMMQSYWLGWAIAACVFGWRLFWYLDIMVGKRAD